MYNNKTILNLTSSLSENRLELIQELISDHYGDAEQIEIDAIIVESQFSSVDNFIAQSIKKSISSFLNILFQ